MKQIAVPWSESGSRFTALFEAVVIDWLTEASIAAVVRRMKLSWDEVDCILQRGIDRGMTRREAVASEHVAVDEVSCRRGHRYLTIVSDRESGDVVHVQRERKQSSLDAFYQQIGEEGCARIESVTMNMWPAYIASTRAMRDDHLGSPRSNLG